MGRILALVLGAAVCVAAGFGLGRLSVQPTPAPHAASTGVSTPKGTTPTAPLPTPKGTTPAPVTPTATPPVATDHHDPDGDEHVHEHAPAPDIAPLPDDVQGPIRDLLTALHDAVHKGDGEAMTEVQRKLSEWVGDDPQRALELLGWFRREADPSSLNIVMGSISVNPRIANDTQVVSAFLDVARRDPSSNRRMEALQFLGQGGKRPPEVEREMVTLARGDPDPSVRVAAIVALRQQIDLDPTAAQRFNPEFLDAASHATDPQVRQQALQAVRIRELTGDQVRGMAAFLRQDEDPSVRITAAEQLGDVRPQYRTSAMETLSEGFRSDSGEDVRRACMLAIVKAGRGEAVGTLRQLREIDPRLSQDIDDYLGILGNGEIDLDRIWEEKAHLEQGRAPQNQFDPPTDR